MVLDFLDFYIKKTYTYSRCLQFDNFHALIDLPGSSYGGRDFPARFSMSLAFASFRKVDVVLPSTEAERLECLRDLGRTMQGRGKPCSDQ